MSNNSSKLLTRDNRVIYGLESSILPANSLDSPIYGRRPVLARWVGKITQAFPAGRVLDVGCWSGEFLRLFPASWERWGVDLQKHPAVEQDVRFVNANIEASLPVPVGFFHLVHCGEVIEHVLSTTSLLMRCHEALAEGGYLIISTPNLACWINGFRWLVGGQPWCVDSDQHQTGHVRYFSPRTLRQTIAALGFRELEFRTVGGLQFLHRNVPLMHKLLFTLFPYRGKIQMLLAQKSGAP